jgi:signal transduction histidine kinase
LALLAVAEPGPDPGLPFVVRQPSADNGARSSMSDVVIAADGIAWIGTASGPVRFDGRRITPLPWVDQVLPIQTLAPSASDAVFGLTRTGDLLAMTPRSSTWIPGPPDVAPPRRLAVDPQDALWVIAGGRALRRDGSGRWSEPLALRLEQGERPVNLRRRGDRLLVTTDRAVWSYAAGIAVRVVRRPVVEPIVDALVTDAGDVVTMTFGGLVERWRGTNATFLAHPGGRGISLAWRDGVLWVSWDARLGRIEGDHAQVWRVTHGGSLAVAPDGALILVGPGGLMVAPEPDTHVLEFHPGVAGVSVRDLYPDGDRLWVATWSGPAVVGPSGVVHPPSGTPVNRGAICPDGTGGAWASVRTEVDAGFWYWRPPEAPRRAGPSPDGGGCSPDVAGGVWLGAGASIWRAPGGDGTAPPVRIADAPFEAVVVRRDRFGRVWIGRQGAVCVAESVGGSLGPWSCHRFGLPTGAWVSDIAAVDRDTAIVTTIDEGLYRIGPNGVDRPEAAETLIRSHLLEGLHPSPRGGVWVSGYDVTLRVDPVTFEELERLDAGHGLPAAGAHAVVETSDGALWVGGATGLVHVAPASRTALARPPAPRLVAARQDGRPVDAATTLRAPPPPSTLTLDFVAPSYRDPTRVRYRLRRGDGKATALPDPSLQLVDLPPGVHRLAVEASLDGRLWSRPAVVTVEVAPPWWQTPWALLAVAAVSAGAVGLVVRWRTSVAVAREQERTRLAMDLHDELGSALGSLRLLTDALGRDRLDEGKRRAIADRVTSTLRDVHESLQVLVGALRPGAATVQDLIQRLEARGRAALEPLGAALEVVVAPEVRARALPVSVRAELERIGLEALHNAARHGRPSHVTLGLAARPDRWEMWVVDDGAGFDVGAARPGGLGLRTLHERARRLGGSANIVSYPGGGCRVTVSFLPPSSSRTRRPS